MSHRRNLITAALAAPFVTLAGRPASAAVNSILNASCGIGRELFGQIDPAFAVA